MSRTGYDAFIIDEASTDPVWIEVSDQKVTFHSAADLWAKETYATEDEVLKRVSQKGAGALVIGPAGENLIRYAVIENDYWRSLGRTGAGAVMGSKKSRPSPFMGRGNGNLLILIGSNVLPRRLWGEPKTVLAFKIIEGWEPLS
jgi:aldehyde:ferredoxin oxidoreductase